MIGTLQTAHLKLVPLTPAYCDLHLKLHTDPDVLRWLDRAPCAGIEQSKQALGRLEKANQEGTGACWIIIDSSSDQPIGTAGIWGIDPTHHRGELGYSLLPEFWRRGLMKEALNAVVEYGFTLCKLHRIEANVNPGNEASICLLRSLGFELEAQMRENYWFDGRYLDSHIYARLSTDVARVGRESRRHIPPSGS